MTPPTSPKRPESPIYEWPPAPSVLASYVKKYPQSMPSQIERVRAALEKCGIVNEHAVQEIMKIFGK